MHMNNAFGKFSGGARVISARGQDNVLAPLPRGGGGGGGGCCPFSAGSASGGGGAV